MTKTRPVMLHASRDRSATLAVTIQAAAAGSNRLSGIAYTGVRMNLLRNLSPGGVVVDLQGMKIPEHGIPLLVDHGTKLTDRIGTVRATIDRKANVVRIEGELSGSGEKVERAREMLASGGGLALSIGAAAYKVERVPKGRSVMVNGRKFDGPIAVLRETELGEVSAVGAGSDSSAIALAAARGKAMKFSEWLEEKGIDIDDLSAVQLRARRAEWAAEAGVEDDDDGDDDSGSVTAGRDSRDAVLAQRQQLAAEAERAHEIYELCGAEHADIAAQAIENGWTDRQIDGAILAKGRKPLGYAGRGDRTERPDASVVEAALCITAGLPSEALGEYFSERTLDRAARDFGGGLGPGELLHLAARVNGNYRGSARDVRGMFQAAFAGDVRASSSSFDISGILGNTANKFLRLGFDSVEASWRDIAEVRSTRDFKEMSFYTLTGDFKYKKVGPNGELEHTDIGEEAYGNKVDTYGRIFGVSRTDIINDDLGALTAVPKRLGRGGALTLNEVFWKEFLDNASFFAAGNSNFASGTDTVLGIDSLTAAETLFYNQTDPDGNPLGVMPRILLVPNALATKAAQLMSSLRIETDASENAPTDNPHAGKFRVVRSSYLSSAALTGNSAKKWYLLAEPGDMPVIQAAFLNGKQAPTVESAQANFSTLGIEMRGWHDFGVRKQEFRGGVAMKGES